MGGGGGIVSSITDALGNAAGSISNFAHDPINSAIRDINNVGSNVWNGGWVTIPGTHLQINLVGALLTPFGFGFVLPLDYRHPDNSNVQSIGPNPFRVQIKVNVNDVPLNKVAFTNVPPENSIAEIKQFFRSHPTTDTYDFCSDVNNSTVRLVFNDTFYGDNDGVINVELCYLGATDDCNVCAKNDVDIAVGFTRIDAGLQYPVAAHGMKYVGTNANGLSTGGRCENNNISDIEARLLNKYKTHYSVSFDDSEDSTELEKDRILDLVYEYNGTTWIRRQNLVESVYYHTGVGNQDNAVFFGGIHDTLAQFTFGYTDETGSLPLPTFDEWDCADKRNVVINSDSLFGVSYPNDLISSVCWQTPSWQISGNFSPDCNTSGVSGCLLFSNPAYASDKTTDLNYIRDPDFPAITILNVGTDGGVYKFDQCLAKTVAFAYPTNYTFNTSAQGLSANTFTVTVTTDSISGVNNGTFTGHINLDAVTLQFKDKFFIYPRDIDVNIPVVGETKNFSVTEINTNQDTVNIIGSLRHGFQYTALDSSTQYYATVGIWVLYFTSFDDIVAGIQANQPVTALQSLIAMDSTSFQASGGTFFGTGTASFSIIDKTGVEVGVHDEDFNWNSSLESCGQDLVSALNISASIGSGDELRWGTPLWSRAFVENAYLSSELAFNARKETADTNVGDILHEIANVNVQSNSIMAIANKRVFVSGHTLSQEHSYKALNGVHAKGFVSTLRVNYEPSVAGSMYPQISTFTITTSGCAHEFANVQALSTVVGSITSDSAVCCAGTHSFPSSAFINTQIGNPTYDISGHASIPVTVDYVDGCIWSVESSVYVAASGSATSSLTYNTSACLYSCPNTAVESLVTGTISGNVCPITGTVYTFPAANFVYTNASAMTLNASGDAYNTIITHTLFDTCLWSVQSASFAVINAISGCTISGSSLNISTSNYVSGSPHSVVESIVSGIISITGLACCSGSKAFPSAFTYNTTIEELSGQNYLAQVTYDLFTACVSGTKLGTATMVLKAPAIGHLLTTLQSCPAGTLTITLSGCENVCEVTTENVLSTSFVVDPSGKAYAEYATTFIQEYRSDQKNKVPESWVASNDYQIFQKNNGIANNSSWKRHMDGVGLGGDAPNYDTIINPQTRVAYNITNWKEIGTWNIGQMAFGSPRNAVIVGGHKVDRRAGNSLVGSGLHAAPTSQRVFIWNQAGIAPEDSYLKNYYARRFNTYSPNGTVPISSNQNLSDLNCIIYDAQSDIVVERVGSVEFDGGSNSVVVVFDTPMPDEVGVNYSISITCDDNVKMWWTGKSTTGFTINSEIATWAGHVDYLATAITQATEDDITNVGNSSGFIFPK